MFVIWKELKNVKTIYILNNKKFQTEKVKFSKY